MTSPVRHPALALLLGLFLAAQLGACSRDEPPAAENSVPAAAAQGVVFVEHGVEALAQHGVFAVLAAQDDQRAGDQQGQA